MVSLGQNELMLAIGFGLVQVRLILLSRITTLYLSNYTIVPVRMKQTHSIWVNELYKSTDN